MPRLHSGRADCARPGAVSGPGQARAGVAFAGHSGVAELLSEIAADGAGTLSGARSVHPVDEAEEHATAHHGRRSDHPPRPRILRLATCGGADARCALAEGSWSPRSENPELGRPDLVVGCGPRTFCNMGRPISLQRIATLPWPGQGAGRSAR